MADNRQVGDLQEKPDCKTTTDVVETRTDGKAD